jgi:tetratricopeptide (TPR) repeat protein
MELASPSGMNAHARSSEFPELSLVDDAPSAPVGATGARDVAIDPEPDLASLPTLPRFPAKRPGPVQRDAANAAAIAPRMELALEPLDHAKPPKVASPSVAPPPPVAPASSPEPSNEGDTMQRLELSLSDEPPEPVARSSAVTAPPFATHAPGGLPLNGPTITPAGAAERYLAEASREFEAGQIDQPLWTRAITQANGDEAAARAAYLKARATAIRIARREVRHERAERRTRAIDELHGAPRAAVHGRGFAGLFTPKRLLAAVAIGGGLVAAAAWLALGDPAPTRPAVAAPANVDANPAARAAAPVAATPAPTGVTPAADKAKSPVQELAGKVAELAAAGNWNVLVLYAAEWTRKDPNNADAWLALGTGYLRLKQNYEAAEALAKAAALAPQRVETWRVLGEAKAAWGATDEALAAYERAVAMDDRDIASLVEMGRLQADKGDLAAAKGTLDRALALNAADTEALCTSAAVAQKGGRAKDAQGYAQKAKSLGTECPQAAPEAPPVRVVGGKPSAQAPARR